jgi:hypothetical protein
MQFQIDMSGLAMLLWMKLSFRTQSKLDNNLFLAAAEPIPTPTPGVLGVALN